MNFTTLLTPDEVVNTISEQTDHIPKTFWTKIRKTTPICSAINKREFELRNNTFHMYSLRAYGKIISENGKTKIAINFEEPPLLYNIYGKLLGRYGTDKKLILSYISNWLKLKKV